MTLSTLKKGSVIKIWHHPRGKDYVVVGDNPISKKLYLLKLTCLNNDGTVHKSTQKCHKALSYTSIGNRRVVKGVSKILGDKTLNDYNLNEVLTNTDSSAIEVPVHKSFVCSPLSDNTDSIDYNQ